jgi:hypothetical protein
MKQFVSFAGQRPPALDAVPSLPAAAGLDSIYGVAAGASSIEPRRAVGPNRAAARLGPRRTLVAPSLRLRVSSSSRSLLRWLRAAELAAWQDADARRSRR